MTTHGEQFDLKYLRHPYINWNYVNELSEAANRKKFREGEEVHVWKVKPSRLTANDQFLSIVEKTKAYSYKLNRDRHRYIIAHDALQKLLRAYCNLCSVKIDKNEFGKPYVVVESNKHKVFFNISRSEDFVCYIFSANSEVGIDIEYINHEFDYSSIAIDYFSTDEIIRIKTAPWQLRLKIFLEIWTGKEALLKAIGVGLNGLNELLSDGHYAERFNLIHFEYKNCYQGALVFAKNIQYIRFYSLDGYI